MKDITVYSKGYCPYCKAAKQIFDQAGVGYKEFDITNNRQKQLEMQQRSQRKTVPQIFFGEQHIGGYTDLVEFLKNKVKQRA